LLTIVPTVTWETYEFTLADLPTEETEIYFAWSHISTPFCYCFHF